MTKRKLTVEAVVFDAAGRVLLVRQGRQPGDWELPGGKVKRHESLTAAVVREVQEEAGVDVVPHHLLGLFFIADEQTHDAVFACQLVGPAVAPRPRPPEIAAAGFFSTTGLPQPIRRFTVARITDAQRGVRHPLPIELRSQDWLR